MGLHWIALLALAQLATASPVHSSSLVVAPLAEAPACATYHGPVGSLALLYLPPSCSAPSGTHGTPFDWSAGRLVWVTESVLDKEVNELRERKAELARTVEGGAQLRFGVEEETRMVLDLGKAGQLVQFPSDEALLSWTSDAAHALTELVAISSLPLPLLKALRTSSTGSSTVDQRSIKRIVDHLAALRFSPLISTLLATFPRKQFKKDVQWLSGEQQGGEEREKWVSRHSMSEGGAKASDWILGQLTGFGLNCSQRHYLPGFAPLVTCEIAGTDPSSGTFVLGAHFDSRGSFGYPTAPGADDDGSGTALLLSIARHISSHRLTFRRKVVLAAFSGEEQGLLGSNFLAREMRERGEDVVLMVQADMIGYRKPGEPRQIAFPDLIGLPEARYLLGNISTLYSPELVVGLTPACCSDHQSFEQQGFASTWVFERNGPIADPFYHNSGDLSEREGYDFEQIYLTSRVVLATLLEVAGFAFV